MNQVQLTVAYSFFERVREEKIKNLVNYTKQRFLVSYVYLIYDIYIYIYIYICLYIYTYIIEICILILISGTSAEIVVSQRLYRCLEIVFF